MKRAIISQPMKGKTEKQIRQERVNAVESLKQQGYQVVDTVFSDYPVENDNENIPLKYLAKSIEFIANVDAVFFMTGWENARGCKIEHECCKQYGVEIGYL